jgi:hypothetical protein
MLCPSRLSWFHHSNNIRRIVKFTEILCILNIMQWETVWEWSVYHSTEAQ